MFLHSEFPTAIDRNMPLATRLQKYESSMQDFDVTKDVRYLIIAGMYFSVFPVDDFVTDKDQDEEVN